MKLSIVKRLLSRQTLCVAASALVGVALATGAGAQTCGMSGYRTVEGVWVEGGSFLVIKATKPFDNTIGCTKSDMLFVPATSPAYKQIFATVLHAQAIAKPINAYVCGCTTYWNKDSWPTVATLGTMTF